MKYAFVWLAVILTTTVNTTTAQESPYVGEQAREIKSLSPETTDGLLNGSGLGYALAAELNSYPGPKHVLELKAELELEPSQEKRIQAVFDTMQNAAKTVGREILKGEESLDTLFASGSATPEVVKQMSVDLGRLYGELRSIHLNAHIGTIGILTKHQSMMYQELRGYNTDDGGDHSHEH